MLETVRAREWSAEQLEAIERREGHLLLEASAGSGKTSVLVERFVRSVLDDGVDVDAILTITFTDKAAAEMRERIRARLRELGAREAARATETAFISTIHGFCARVLRGHALEAQLDPAFAVLDEPDSARLADGAFEDALEDLGRNAPGGIELIAAYGVGPLRGAILGVYAELRSRGELRPGLPELPAAPDLDRARSLLRQAAAAAAAELGRIDDPSAKVVQALERLDRCVELSSSPPEPWPGDLEALCLPGGNGAALATARCDAYAEALGSFRGAVEHRRAARARDLLERLLRSFGERYEQRKRGCSGLDFGDLELLALELLRRDAGLCERYRERFARIMVDELQDTNRVQLELIELLARGNLFTVGDAQQSIYAFRHADVELFERRANQLEQAGARATLETNFRSRPEIIEVLNLAFAGELGERFRPLRAGRACPPADDPRVELIVVDKGAEWESEALAAPWRLAEAAALASRVRELIDEGATPRQIVVLTRAATDLRAYERALEEHGIPTYVIGGRGYWSHPQVLDLLCYLRALANPRDEEALYTVLASPLVGVSLDALVVLAATARERGRDPWWVLRDPAGAVDELRGEDLRRLEAFARWFAAERSRATRDGVEQLIERVLELTGYDLAVLAMPGGQRRLANVRKLMRLGREYEAPGLREFLDLVARRSAGWEPGGRHESEAPVEGEALDAVRLMTIHRAKGLEFQIVCVADLGRSVWARSELLRVGRDGRLGLRLAQPGTGKREPALEYRALGEEQLQADGREERRLFYVAMTRACERLVVSGAANLECWPVSGSPIAWVGPALLGDLPACLAQGSGVTEAGVRFSFLRDAAPAGDADAGPAPPAAPAPPVPPPQPPPPAAPAPPVSAVSYSSLAEYQRCGYRFYVERVLGLPAVSGPAGAGSGGGLRAAERGVLLHALLERLDFRRPVMPSLDAIAAAARQAGVGSALSEGEAAEIVEMVGRFAASDLCARLARATQVRREQRFGFVLDGVLVGGVLDVMAREASGATLVVDYKSDRLGGAHPSELVDRAYATQRIVYALAALRSGAPAVEVVHVLLELPDAPAVAAFGRADVGALEERLGELVRGVLRRDFAVAEAPHRGLCEGCPAEGGLCSWPVSMTRREAPDRLF